MKPENLLEKNDEKFVKNLTYKIRDMQVMLDSDVAFFFKESVGRVNQQMSRNKIGFQKIFALN